MGAVAKQEVRSQNLRDQKAGFALALNQKKYPVEKAKGGAKKYTET